jgi:hypothetical protein
VGQKGCIEELKFWLKLSLNVMQGRAVRSQGFFVVRLKDSVSSRSFLPGQEVLAAIHNMHFCPPGDNMMCRPVPGLWLC